MSVVNLTELAEARAKMADRGEGCQSHVDTHQVIAGIAATLTAADVLIAVARAAKTYANDGSLANWTRLRELLDKVSL